MTRRAAGVLQHVRFTSRADGDFHLDHVAPDMLESPCIEPCCYEFAPDDLGVFVDRWGSGVVSATADGRPALDVPVVVAAALDGLVVWQTSSAVPS